MVTDSKLQTELSHLANIAFTFNIAIQIMTAFKKYFAPPRSYLRRHRLQICCVLRFRHPCNV